MVSDILKNDIIKKSMELFSSMGVKVVTMDDIAKELFISKKTIYTLFSKKEDIIKESVNIMIHSMEKEIELINNKNIHPVSEIRELNDIYIYYFGEILTSSNMLQISKYYSDIYNYLDINIYNIFYKSLRYTLRRGIDENIYRVSILDNDFYIIIYNNLLKSIIRDIKINRMEKKLILEAQFFLFARGISSGKGFSMVDMEEKRISFR